MCRASSRYPACSKLRAASRIMQVLLSHDVPKDKPNPGPVPPMDEPPIHGAVGATFGAYTSGVFSILTRLGADASLIVRVAEDGPVMTDPPLLVVLTVVVWYVFAAAIAVAPATAFGLLYRIVGSASVAHTVVDASSISAIIVFFMLFPLGYKLINKLNSPVGAVVLIFEVNITNRK